MGPGFQACLEMLAVRENYSESEAVLYCRVALLLVVVSTNGTVTDLI